MCLTALLTSLLLCRFDIVNMLKLGCVSNGSYLSSLFTAASLVLMVGLVVGAIYMFEMQALDRVNYQSDSKQVEKELRRLYDQFDANGNDRVEIHEVKEIVRMIEKRINDPHSTACTDVDIDELFKAADKNNNGHIDFNEFQAAVNEIREDDSAHLNLGWWVEKKAQANVRDDATGRLFFMVFLLCAL
jgi:Ca2+-binding EF-hand superfamily protein